MHVSMLQHYIGDKRIICTLSFFCKHSYSGALISAQCKLEQAFFIFFFSPEQPFPKGFWKLQISLLPART